MRVHRPARTPSSADDLSVPRVSARTHGDSGFIFLNNHTRNAVMPAHPGFQVRLKLPGETLLIPQAPITLPSGTYGIWPVNLDMDGVRLRYSTAQLMSRLDHHNESYIFFFGLPGIAPEFLLDASASSITAHGFTETRSAKGLQLRAREESGDIVVRSARRPLHLVLLPRSDAENLWKINDSHALLLTKADVFSNGPETMLQQEEDAVFPFRLFGASTGRTTRLAQQNQLFVPYRGSVPPVPLQVTAHQTAAAGARAPLKNGPPASWRKSPIPMAPDDEDFAQAARWTLTLRGDAKAPQLADVLVRIRYQGDVARLHQSGLLLDDDFWNGVPWTFGTQQLGLNPSLPITVEILPLPQTFPMYLESRSDNAGSAQSGSEANLQSVQAVPLYRWSFTSHPN